MPNRKQINVGAFGDAGQRIRNGNQPECYQQGGADHGPDRFGEIEGTQDDARSRERSDDVDRLCCVGLHGGLQVAALTRRTIAGVEALDACPSLCSAVVPLILQDGLGYVSGIPNKNTNVPTVAIRASVRKAAL